MIAEFLWENSVPLEGFPMNKQNNADVLFPEVNINSIRFILRYVLYGKGLR